MRIVVTTKKTFRTNGDPPRIANREPIIAPNTFATARARPSFHQIWPVSWKETIAPKFVAIFTNLAVAEALRKAYPTKPTSKKTRKVPVPGPKIPS
jgi:hypothetical protein